MQPDHYKAPCTHKYTHTHSYTGLHKEELILRNALTEMYISGGKSEILDGYENKNTEPEAASLDCLLCPAPESNFYLGKCDFGSPTHRVDRHHRWLNKET